MVVLSINFFIFEKVQGQTCEVYPFDPTKVTTNQVPIVDAAIAYNVPFPVPSNHGNLYNFETYPGYGPYFISLIIRVHSGGIRGH